MRQSFQYRWRQFISGLQDDGITAVELLRMLLQFLRESTSALNEKPLVAYRLDQFSTLHAEDYPVELTSSSKAEVSHLLVILRRSKNKKPVLIAQLLRDVLEQLLVVESNCDCPNCASGGMGVFKNRADERLVLQCKHCGHCFYFDDGSNMGEGELIFLTTSDLRKASILGADLKIDISTFH